MVDVKQSLKIIVEMVDRFSSQAKRITSTISNIGKSTQDMQKYMMGVDEAFLGKDAAMQKYLQATDKALLGTSTTAQQSAEKMADTMALTSQKMGTSQAKIVEASEKAQVSLNKQGVWVNNLTGEEMNLAQATGMIGRHFRRFNMNMLSVMFLGMQLTKTFGTLVDNTLKMTGVMDFLNTSISFVLLDALWPLQEALIGLGEFLLDAPPAVQQMVGMFVLFGDVLGNVLFFVGALALGLGGLGATAGGIAGILALPGFAALFSALATMLGITTAEMNLLFTAMGTGMAASLVFRKGLSKAIDTTVKFTAKGLAGIMVTAKDLVKKLKNVTVTFASNIATFLSTQYVTLLNWLKSNPTVIIKVGVILFVLWAAWELGKLIGKALSVEERAAIEERARIFEAWNITEEQYAGEMESAWGVYADTSVSAMGAAGTAMMKQNATAKAYYMGITENITDSADAFTSFESTTVEVFSESSTAMSSMSDNFGTELDTVNDALNETIAYINDMNTAVSNLSGKKIEIDVSTKKGGIFGWGFLGLQHGGIVTRPTPALIGEAGPEAVIPLNKLGGMGTSIIINQTNNISGLDMNEVDAAITRNNSRMVEEIQRMTTLR